VDVLGLSFLWDVNHKVFLEYGNSAQLLNVPIVLFEVLILMHYYELFSLCTLIFTALTIKQHPATVPGKR